MKSKEFYIIQLYKDQEHYFQSTDYNIEHYFDTWVKATEYPSRAKQWFHIDHFLENALVNIKLIHGFTEAHIKRLVIMCETEDLDDNSSS